MPNVMRIDGARVVIYPEDHAPEHVHVISAGREAIFLLNCPAGPVSLRESEGFRSREVTRLMRALDEAVVELCNQWNTIHGDR